MTYNTVACFKKYGVAGPGSCAPINNQSILFVSGRRNETDGQADRQTGRQGSMEGEGRKRGARRTTNKQAGGQEREQGSMRKG